MRRDKKLSIDNIAFRAPLHERGNSNYSGFGNVVSKGGSGGVN
jgi:hypothetical protein